jgi:hypothetical protein
MGKYNALQFISMDALFDNPYDLLNTEYYDQFASAEFYAPSYVQMEVIDTLTQKYVNYYRQMHMNPNLTPASIMEQRDVAKNEHTMNIRAGLAVLKTMYSMHMDEYDYIDIAVDTLRNIKHFGLQNM